MKTGLCKTTRADQKKAKATAKKVKELDENSQGGRPVPVRKARMTELERLQAHANIVLGKRKR